MVAITPLPLVQAMVNDQKLTEPILSVGWTRVLDNTFIGHRGYIRNTFSVPEDVFGHVLGVLEFS